MRQLRKKAGLTQRELAQRIRVSQAYISRLEHGYIGGLTIDKLLKISKALSICPYALLIILIKIPYNENCFTTCKQNFFNH